jgi:lipopolysaccharide biosynthesis protein
MKRLFLFAAYEEAGVVGESLLWYLKSLSKVGDVVLVADSDIEPVQLEPLGPYCLYAQAVRHEEYDFGSYKRANAWANANLDLSSYDYVYMVNDSVYGPLYELEDYILKMEAMGVPAFSLIVNPHKRHPHMQSWFIGLDRSVFLQEWFASFLASVKKEANKNDICVIYETGLTELVTEKGVPYKGLYEVSGKKIYNSVKDLYNAGLPFVKKAAFTRHDGSLGAQLKYVVDHLDADAQNAILADAKRVYGAEYVEGLLTSNTLTIAGRYLSYLFSKI